MRVGIIALQGHILTGAEFRETRQKLALTQENLAHRLGVSQRSIIRIEASDTVPDMPALALTWIVVQMSGTQGSRKPVNGGRG